MRSFLLRLCVFALLAAVLGIAFQAVRESRSHQSVATSPPTHTPGSGLPASDSLLPPTLQLQTLG